MLIIVSNEGKAGFEPAVSYRITFHKGCNATWYLKCEPSVFPEPEAIEKEADKKAFAKLFGEYLRVENVLQNYDEFVSLRALQTIDLNDPAEINLDYILELIFEHHKKTKSKSELVEEMRRIIRGSLGNRAKESLIVDFINQTDLDQLADKASVLASFYAFAREELQREATEKPLPE